MFKILELKKFTNHLKKKFKITDLKLDTVVDKK